METDLDFSCFGFDDALPALGSSEELQDDAQHEILMGYPIYTTLLNNLRLMKKALDDKTKLNKKLKASRAEAVKELQETKSKLAIALGDLDRITDNMKFFNDKCSEEKQQLEDTVSANMKHIEQLELLIQEQKSIMGKNAPVKKPMPPPKTKRDRTKVDYTPPPSPCSPALKSTTTSVSCQTSQPNNLRSMEVQTDPLELCICRRGPPLELMEDDHTNPRDYEPLQHLESPISLDFDPSDRGELDHELMQAAEETLVHYEESLESHYEEVPKEVESMEPEKIQIAELIVNHSTPVKPLVTQLDSSKSIFDVEGDSDSEPPQIEKSVAELPENNESAEEPIQLEEPCAVPSVEPLEVPLDQAEPPSCDSDPLVKDQTMELPVFKSPSEPPVNQARRNVKKVNTAELYLKKFTPMKWVQGPTYQAETLSNVSDSEDSEPELHAEPPSNVSDSEPETATEKFFGGLTQSSEDEESLRIDLDKIVLNSTQEEETADVEAGAEEETMNAKEDIPEVTEEAPEAEAEEEKEEYFFSPMSPVEAAEPAQPPAIFLDDELAMVWKETTHMPDLLEPMSPASSVDLMPPPPPPPSRKRKQRQSPRTAQKVHILEAEYQLPEPVEEEEELPALLDDKLLAIIKQPLSPLLSLSDEEPQEEIEDPDSWRLPPQQVLLFRKRITAGQYVAAKRIFGEHLACLTLPEKQFSVEMLHVPLEKLSKLQVTAEVLAKSLLIPAIKEKCSSPSGTTKPFPLSSVERRIVYVIKKLEDKNKKWKGLSTAFIKETIKLMLAARCPPNLFLNSDLKELLAPSFTRLITTLSMLAKDSSLAKGLLQMSTFYLPPVEATLIGATMLNAWPQVLQPESKADATLIQCLWRLGRGTTGRLRPLLEMNYGLVPSQPLAMTATEILDLLPFKHIAPG